MKSLINDLVITYDEIIDTPDNELIDSLNKKLRYKMDYYVFHSILLVTIRLLLLIIITAINFYYMKH